MDEELDLQSIAEAIESLQQKPTDTPKLGRPKGSTNKAKVAPPEANHLAFIRELEDCMMSWLEDQPVRYDFECIEEIKAMMAKHGL